jgi:hypothetical protein
MEKLSLLNYTMRNKEKDQFIKTMQLDILLDKTIT